MTIVAITIKNIKGEVKKPIIDAVKIEHSPKIEDVKRTKIVDSISEGNSIPALDIKYSFKITYTQNEEEIASLFMEGDILYKGKDEKEVEELEEEWKKEKKLKGKEIDILNAIMKKGIPKFMYLTDVLALPPVIQIPRFTKK